MTFERIASGLLTVSALLIAGVLVKRELIPQPTNASSLDATAPDSVAEWRDALAAGYRVGSTAAPVTIVEVTDLECPACAQFQSVLTEVVAASRGRASVVYVHYALPQHRFAQAAARGADCAAREGRLEEWMRAVYAKQDSLGFRSWGAFAHDAGLPDTTSLVRCAVNSAPVPRLVASQAFGDSIKIRGTPTVIVNGWRHPSVPTKAALAQAIDRAAAGKRPFDLRRD